MLTQLKIVSDHNYTVVCDKELTKENIGNICNTYIEVILVVLIFDHISLQNEMQQN